MSDIYIVYMALLRGVFEDDMRAPHICAVAAAGPELQNIKRPYRGAFY